MHSIKPAARKRGRVPRFLLTSLISASLMILSICFIAPQARAEFQDGAATTIDGTIHEVKEVDGGFEFYIEDDAKTSLVYILSKDKMSCRLFSRIHATGKISRPVMGSDHVDWQLTDASFSCQQPLER